MAYTDIEKRILDKWPKFEDGTYVMLGDKAIANSGENSGKEFTVKNIYFESAHGKLRSSALDGCYWNWKAADTYVKRPAPKVLDADGVEIKVGDTVYDTKGEEHIVKEVYFDYDESHEHIVWCGESKSGIAVVYIADQLSHIRPDSWERLERDADNGPCGYFDFNGKECTGCPAFGSVKTCIAAVCADIVRRAKALAEKEAAR